MRDILLIALAWFAYGLVHSWLAGSAVKAWVTRHWPRLAPAYRLAYNAIATLLLIPPLALTLSMPGEVVWDVPGWIAWPAAIVAVAGFVWSLRWYDMGEFLGLTQWRQHDGREHEGFVLSPPAPLCAPPLVQPGSAAALDARPQRRLAHHGGGPDALSADRQPPGGAQTGRALWRGLPSLSGAGAGAHPLARTPT